MIHTYRKYRPQFIALNVAFGLYMYVVGGIVNGILFCFGVGFCLGIEREVWFNTLHPGATY